MGALAIPDLCAALAPDGLTNGSRYEAWFDTHVAPTYGSFLTGKDAWGLRCSILHQGRTQPHQGSYSRVLFVEPGHGFVMHRNVMDDALNLDVRLFCADLVTAARSWLGQVETTPTYQANYPAFLQRYANGLAPYIVGIPVLS
jgi:hypothetical protein